MRSLLISLAVLCSIATAVMAADNDSAIKAKLDQFQAAWNKDDTKAMAAVWAEDGSLINPVGDYANNRADVEKSFVAEHTGRFKATQYTTSDVKLQSVTPDVVVADVTANITGIKSADGNPAPDYLHHVTWVFVKKDGQWMAASARPYQFGQK